MSHTYFVCPMDIGIPQRVEDFYAVDLDVLVRALRARWHVVQVNDVAAPHSHVSCTWTMDLGRGPFYCTLSKDRNSLWIEGGDAQDNATLAVWFRRLVPPEYRLSFFHPEEYPRQIELTMETTERDVIEFAGGPLPRYDLPRDQNP